MLLLAWLRLLMELRLWLQMRLWPFVLCNLRVRLWLQVCLQHPRQRLWVRLLQGRWWLSLRWLLLRSLLLF